ncbi:MAG: hypothetical protein K1X82_00085 [Bacteroidia bacterium]|nr:hypothetical protein [Bacteroidia bacterium]
MKKVVSVLFLLVIVGIRSVLAQTATPKAHFEFVKVVSPESKDHTLKMMQVIDLERFRLLDQRRKIEVYDGTIIELYSANELREKYQRKPSPTNKLWTPGLPSLIMKYDVETQRPIIVELN